MSENNGRKTEKRETQPMGLIGLAAWVTFLATVLGCVYIVWGG